VTSCHCLQAAARTNDTAGDGTTTATVLSAAFIAEGMKIVSAGTNPVQLVRGMEKTVQHLVKELAKMSVEIRTDKDLANVASVSAGGCPGRPADMHAGDNSRGMLCTV
jgi:chaperonin GroEL